MRISFYQKIKSIVQYSNKAFSLLELLIYISILAIVMVVLSASFTAINKGSGKSEAQIEVNSNLRFVLELIGRDIRSASSISVPSSGTTSSSLITTVSGTQVAYCLTNGTLRRQLAGVCSVSSEGISSKNVLITNLLFTRLENSNTITGKTAVSIEVVVGMSYAGTNPDRQYSGSKKTTFMMY